MRPKFLLTPVVGVCFLFMLGCWTPPKHTLFDIVEFPIVIARCSRLAYLASALSGHKLLRRPLKHTLPHERRRRLLLFRPPSTLCSVGFALILKEEQLEEESITPRKRVRSQFYIIVVLVDCLSSAQIK